MLEDNIQRIEELLRETREMIESNLILARTNNLQPDQQSDHRQSHQPTRQN
jgi:hypothetical protein